MRASNGRQRQGMFRPFVTKDLTLPSERLAAKQAEEATAARMSDLEAREAAMAAREAKFPAPDQPIKEVIDVESRVEHRLPGGWRVRATDTTIVFERANSDKPTQDAGTLELQPAPGLRLIVAYSVPRVEETPTGDTNDAGGTAALESPTSDTNQDDRNQSGGDNGSE